MTIAANGQVTFTQTLIGTALDISGDIDVDGTTNLDVVDIDGAVDMASTLAVGGVVTANAGVVVDNFTLDGTTLALSSGDMTLDVAGDIILDADGGDIFFKNGGTAHGNFLLSGTDFTIGSSQNNGDLIFRGIGGGSDVTALTLDMSAGGDATFAAKVNVGENLLLNNNYEIRFKDSGGTERTAIELDNSNNFVVGTSASGVHKFVGGGGYIERFRINTDGSVVFNETSLDQDFRVESNGNANMLFVDGGNNRVGIGTASPDALLRVAGTAKIGEGAGSNDAKLMVNTQSGVAAGIQLFQDGVESWIIQNPASNTALTFSSSGTERLSIATNGAATFTPAAGGHAVFNEGSVDADFRVESNGNTHMLFVDGGNDRVGIGTTSPETNLHVKGGSDMGIRIESDNDGYASLQFGDADDTVRGGITYNNADDSLQLRGYNNAARATIDSSGRLLVGKTAVDNTTVGFRFDGSSGFASFVRDGESSLLLVRKSDDGDILQFKKDTATVGSIGTEGGDLTIGTGDVGLKFNNGSSLISPWDTTANAPEDGLFDLGYSNGRFKDLYLSGGAYLGGTGTANKLDDYEEGTWTATTTGGGTFTIGTNSCLYTKIGRQVTCKFNLTFSAASGTTAFITIGGLPFGVANISANYGANPLLIDNLASATDVYLVQTSINSTTMILITSAGGTAGHDGLAGNQITTDTTIRGTVVYFTA
jgi:cytoskeletal protein CcmA (bactofilin family)